MKEEKDVDKASVVGWRLMYIIITIKSLFNARREVPNVISR